MRHAYRENASALHPQCPFKPLKKALYKTLNQHRQRLRAARPRGPCQPRERAQKDFRRAASFFDFGWGAGALRCDPVAALYFARPFAVSPPPRFTESFSPRPTDKLARPREDDDTIFLCKSQSQPINSPGMATVLGKASVGLLDHVGVARHQVRKLPPGSSGQQRLGLRGVGLCGF